MHLSNLSIVTQKIHKNSYSKFNDFYKSFLTTVTIQSVLNWIFDSRWLAVIRRKSTKTLNLASKSENPLIKLIYLYLFAAYENT